MKRLPLTAAFTLLPLPALAHAGHDSGTLLSGVLHPLGGADHVLAMVAVGVLAAQIGGRALWALPLGFVSAMLVGGLIGAAGLGYPAVEPMILASILLFGALVALALRPPLAALLGLVALFGAAHGWAHGAEGPSGALAPYALGFASATTALHLAGIGLGRAVPDLVLRGLGAATALAGLALAAV